MTGISGNMRVCLGVTNIGLSEEGVIWGLADVICVCDGVINEVWEVGVVTVEPSIVTVSDFMWDSKTLLQSRTSDNRGRSIG